VRNQGHFTLNIFQQPEETTAGPGIYGTLHNNQQIDLAQEPDSKNIDEEARNRDLDIPGFLCGGHTAHSTEAGRSTSCVLWNIC